MSTSDFHRPAARRGLLVRPEPLDAALAARFAWAMTFARELDATSAAGPRRVARLLRGVRDAFDAVAAAATLVGSDGRVEHEQSVGWRAEADLARAARRLAPTRRDGGAIEDVAPLADGRAARLFLFRHPARPFDEAEAGWLRLVHAGCAWAYPLAVSRAASPVPGRLSIAARQTLDALLDGASERAASVRLRRSPHTVHTHVKQIYRAYGVRSRAELLARFLADGERDAAGAITGSDA